MTRLQKLTLLMLMKWIQDIKDPENTYAWSQHVHVVTLGILCNERAPSQKARSLGVIRVVQNKD